MLRLSTCRHIHVNETLVGLLMVGVIGLPVVGKSLTGRIRLRLQGFYPGLMF